MSKQQAKAAKRWERRVKKREERLKRLREQVMVNKVLRVFTETSGSWWWTGPEEFGR